MNLVRHSAHLLTPIEALQRVLVPLTTVSSPFHLYHHRHRSNPLLHRPEARHYNWSRRTGVASKFTRRHDEEIDDRFVQLVSESSGLLLAPEEPRAILARMDRKADFLVEMAPAAESKLPICRIIPRRQVLEYESMKRKKPRTKEKLMKQLELNWAIGQNDLQHKLDRMKQFLDEGRRVELTIAKKRRGRDATPDERRTLLAAIRAFVQNSGGVREWKAMVESGGTPEEKVGDRSVRGPLTTILFFEGNKTPGSRTKGPDTEDAAATDDFYQNKDEPIDPAPAVPVRHISSHQDKAPAKPFRRVGTRES